MQENDADIIKKVLAGDREAYSSLAEKYARSIGSIAFSYIGNEESARDIAQESLFEAFVKLKTLRNPENFKSWLYQITKNKTKNWIKHRKTEKNALHEKASQAIKATNTTEDNSIQKEKLLKALKKLNEKEKEIVLLRYYSGICRKDAAEILSISEKAADKRLQRAMQKLREELKDVE